MGVDRKRWLSGGMASREVKKRSDDLFERIRRAAEREPDYRPRRRQLDLGTVCSINLGASKTGRGSEVVGIYRQRRFAELANYCMDDVRITSGLSSHMDRTGRVAIPNNKKT